MKARFAYALLPDRRIRALRAAGGSVEGRSATVKEARRETVLDIPRAKRQPPREASSYGHRYTRAELRKLGEGGKALPIGRGAYDWPIVTVGDLMLAVRDRPSSELVRKWGCKRAKRLGREDLLPQLWTGL